MSADGNLRIVDHKDGTFAIVDASKPVDEDKKTVFYQQIADGFTSRAEAERFIVEIMARENPTERGFAWFPEDNGVRLMPLSDDVFTRIMATDGVGFPEAVKWAATGNVIPIRTPPVDAKIIPFPVRETPPMIQLADELRAIATEITKDGPTARRAASLRRIADWIEREGKEAEEALALFGFDEVSSSPAREPDDEPPF